VRASLRLRLERARDGSVRVDGDLATPPLWCRWDGDTLWLVGSAASPVGRDHVELHLHVGPGVQASVRSVAAMILYAGAGEGTAMVTTIDVAEGATLRWQPEPVIVTARARHRALTRVRAEGTAQVLVDEVVVFGRSEERAEGRSGALHSTLEAQVDRRQVLLTSYDSSVPGWSGPGGADGAAVAATRLLVDGCDRPDASIGTSPGGTRGTVLEPAAGVRLGVLLADAADAARAGLDHLLPPSVKSHA
jgi:urease accessory protein